MLTIHEVYMKNVLPKAAVNTFCLQLKMIRNRYENEVLR